MLLLKYLLLLIFLYLISLQVERHFGLDKHLKRTKLDCISNNLDGLRIIVKRYLDSLFCMRTQPGLEECEGLLRLRTRARTGTPAPPPRDMIDVNPAPAARG